MTDGIDTPRIQISAALLISGKAVEKILSSRERQNRGKSEKARADED